MPADLAVVETRERGHADVPQGMWRKLAGSPEFWALVEAGIVAVSQPSRATMRLSGTQYVGIARIGDVTLQVREKVPGALRCLIGFATNGAFEVVKADAPETEFGELTSLLIHQFLVGLRRYVSKGREFRWGTQRSASPFVRGRLDMVATIKLRAKGLGHLVAFDRNVQDFRTPTNLVLMSAVRQIEILNGMISVEPADLAAARSMALFFADCRTTDVLFGRRASWADRAQQLARSADSAAMRDLLSLAAVLLARQGFEDADAGDGILPRSWFLNLEELFETAVRRLMSDLVEAGTTVANGKALSQPIFPMNPGKHHAEPDLVVRRASGEVIIGDVKHKEWKGDASPGELYQLLVHAEAYGAARCFLVFPGEEFAFLSLGVTAAGVEVFICMVDVRKLDVDVLQLLGRLGLATAALTGAA